jgi:hypothetical protein
MCLESIQGNEKNRTHRRGDGRPVRPAVCGLFVRDDAGSTEHEVLRFHALRSVQSESRLLQRNGFGAVTECPPRSARDISSARDGCDRYSRFTAGNDVPRSASLAFRGSAAFASRTVHPALFPPDLIRCSTVQKSTGLSLFPSPLST